MQRSKKSARHVNAARCRWRAAEARAQAELEAGITDRETHQDCRQRITIDLRSYGGERLHIEPRMGYIACRMLDDAGTLRDCAALKTLLHRLADALPRTSFHA